jgi:signal transduction histidine kinase
MAKAQPSGSPSAPRQLAFRPGWPLLVIMVVVFALGQMFETLLGVNRVLQIIFDLLGWSVLSGLAIWLSTIWVRKRDERHQLDLQAALQSQQELNRKLQRANSHLALLSETNRHIASSSTLDEILDLALLLPQRLVPSDAAALVLMDPTGPIETRIAGLGTLELAHLRESFGILPHMAEARQPRLCWLDEQPANPAASCLLLPLHDGLAPVGWIELYLDARTTIAADELHLLETMASEIAEAIVGARRRSREERAIYELERAIADERARIARDIHDGIAQSMAFLRMRVDLWQDWIEGDPERLREELSELKHTLRSQIRELRRAIFALRPVQFDELGFVGGLRRYIVEFAGQQGWDVNVDLKDAPPALSLELEAICFRIVQEALTNAAKHAGASAVQVTIDQVDRGVRVMVADNGLGFEPGALSDDTSERVGLRQMRERLGAVRGQLTLLSRPGAGTEVRVWMPLPLEHEAIDSCPTRLESAC